MCGIVGYLGKKDCTKVLLDSLSKLEYRGYDSAGIAVFENDSIKVAKTKGRIAQLEERINHEGGIKGNCGIGHTRWATHGEPSDVNSHPHGDANISIVHNGIIENYSKIKSFLETKGYVFESQTDTETVAKLLDFYYDGDPLNTIKNVLGEIEGSYALGILFKDFPDRIYAVRKDSPLIVGIGDDEAFIASDVPAFLKYTNKYYLLDTNEIVVLSNDGVEIFDKHGAPIEKELMVADWDMEAAEKGGYEHFMLKEINEQPAAINATISPRIKDGMPDLSECGLTQEKLAAYSNIFVVACGTAMHAGLVGKYVIESIGRIPVIVDVASEFRYRNPIVTDKDLVIVVSQSGETADTLEALKLSRKKGADTLAIVNVVGSSIAREADMVIYTHAGPEISVASTKAYSVQIAVFYLLAFELAYAKGAISQEECIRLTKELQSVPATLEIVLKQDELCKYVASTLVNAENLLYIGRGLDYALSMEGSLKLKEISYIHSESYAAGELKHGTISLVTDTMPIIAVATQRDLFDKTVSNAKEVKARGGKVIFVSHSYINVDDDVADYKIGLPTIDDLLMPMVAVVPLQLIAYYTSVLRGNDVDKPRNLAKSVTVE
ncbi:MAG: glutamine--fructose-6-phosphate transaminase (isomerizing) [Ruminococcus sp.]|nr:glutamine--fructose-6-phosphate transaminase (isomerizing) [Ruminococcus sp.]